MKKIIILTLTALLLTSCFNKTEENMVAPSPDEILVENIQTDEYISDFDKVY